jgi:hypothetical protein
MNYPDRQGEYLSEALYLTDSFDVYKDRIIEEHRQRYRRMLPASARSAGREAAAYNWHYSERVNINRMYPDVAGARHSRARKSRKNQPQEIRGMVIEREINSYSGCGPELKQKRYSVFDMDGLAQVRIDDLFIDYQGNTVLRDIVYEELRKHSKLERTQALSKGFYFTDRPELSFNFFITDEGLGLRWDPEQIAPYSVGAIEIILLWQVIRPMMLDTGVELLAKFGISFPYPYNEN